MQNFSALARIGALDPATDSLSRVFRVILLPPAFPEMNLLPVSIKKKGASVFADLGSDNLIELPNACQSTLEPGQGVIFGIYPEDLEPADTGIAVKLRDMELLGAETQIFAGMGNTLVTSVSRGIFRSCAGHMQKVQPDPTRVHLFDTESRLINPADNLDNGYNLRGNYRNAFATIRCLVMRS